MTDLGSQDHPQRDHGPGRDYGRQDRLRDVIDDVVRERGEGSGRCDVLIAGAGFAGFTFAIALRQSLGPDFRVMLDRKSTRLNSSHRR